MSKRFLTFFLLSLLLTVSGEALGQSPIAPQSSRVAQGPGCPAERLVFVIRASEPTGVQKQILRQGVGTSGAIVLLGPDVDLDFSGEGTDGVPLLQFAQCVTLTSAETLPPPIFFRMSNPQTHPPIAGAAALDIPPPARTPHSLGPVLRFGPHRNGALTFLELRCDAPVGSIGQADSARISGFRLIGPSYGQQATEEVGIRIHRCIDVEVSNMEIAGWGGQAVRAVDQPIEGTPQRPEPAGRNTYPAQIRIHDNYIHNNQQPIHDGHAGGYGVDTGDGAWTQIAHNVFDFNRHSIAANGHAGGYDARANLILKGGGYHNGFGNNYTHVIDVHGTGCFWSADLCGAASDQFWIVDNAVQYRKDTAVKIRGTPLHPSYIWRNLFPHASLGSAIKYESNVSVLKNTTGFDSYGRYGVCDFDGDKVDDLFLPTGATWWFSSYGEFHWSFLSAKTERMENIRFGYFDADLRCDVATAETGGRWVFSSGGVGPWQPLGSFNEPLSDVAFGRFDPNVRDLRPGATRRTTHAFRRAANGQWFVTPLSAYNWQPVQSSSFPMNKLRFGDFTGDGVTDVLAVVGGRWAISQSARGSWRRINANLGDAVGGLFIANMDADDNIDDLLRLDRTYTTTGTIGHTTLRWWRSKNGVDIWRPWRSYTFTYSLVAEPLDTVWPVGGFAGRFGLAPGGGTLIIDHTRKGQFFSPAEVPYGRSPNWSSLFSY